MNDPNESPNISGNPRYWCHACRHWCDLDMHTCIAYCLTQHAAQPSRGAEGEQ